MSRVSVLSRLRIDPYIVALLATVAVASLLPARGVVVTGFGYVTTIAIGFLFFLYGARLSTKEAMDGLTYWRLHSVVFVSTFLLFPLLGLAAKLLVPGVLTPELYVGLMFLCCLPATVQSAIAFTSIARGNVAAAICSASSSNLIGIVLTPLLVALLLGSSGDRVSLDSVRDIIVQLLVPFVAGQLLRRWIGGFVTQHKKVLGYVDRGAILLVVYAAFSRGVVAGIWERLTPVSLMLLLMVNIVLLAIVMMTTTVAARRLGFSREDEIAIVFCGSKKSLASGVPMAIVLFPAATVSLTVLPLMLFHQIQLMVSAVLARRYAARSVPPQPAEKLITVPIDQDAESWLDGSN
ncbi:MAG TPA: bile acid:sodium symporter family protein [Pseudonocardiaceae bacterium]|nr:bile acid:sodium symporter family protein [Pseudonocardiaceae bacterium]